ncbi:MAG: hypothetical protein ACJA1A_001908, partial [Saprospiraceae bacterium]
WYLFLECFSKNLVIILNIAQNNDCNGRFYIKHVTNDCGISDIRHYS